MSSLPRKTPSSVNQKIPLAKKGKRKGRFNPYDEQKLEEKHVVLLGCGSSGKRTTYTLARPHPARSSSSERNKNCFFTIFDFTQSLANLFSEEKLSFLDLFTDEEADFLKEIVENVSPPEDKVPFLITANAIWQKILSDDTLTLECYNRFRGLEEFPYSFERILRELLPKMMDFSVKNGADMFEPTEEEDCLARRKTAGVVQDTFDYHSKRINVINTGGQRSERKKWQYAVTPSTSLIIFHASLPEFDLRLYEHTPTPSLSESLSLLTSLLSPFSSSPLFGTSFTGPFVVYFSMFEVFQRKIELGVNFEEFVPQVRDPIRIQGGIWEGEEEKRKEDGGDWYEWEVGERDLKDPKVIMEYLIIKFLSVIPKEERWRVSFCFGTSFDIQCRSNLLRVMGGEVTLKPIFSEEGGEEKKEGEEKGEERCPTTAKKLNYSDLCVYNLFESEQFTADGEVLKAGLGDKEAAELVFPPGTKVVDLTACNLSVIPLSLASLDDKGGVVVRLGGGGMEGVDKELIKGGDSGAIIRHAKGMLSGERLILKILKI